MHTNVVCTAPPAIAGFFFSSGTPGVLFSGSASLVALTLLDQGLIFWYLVWVSFCFLFDVRETYLAYIHIREQGGVARGI